MTRLVVKARTSATADGAIARNESMLLLFSGFQGSSAGNKFNDTASAPSRDHGLLCLSRINAGYAMADARLVSTGAILTGPGGVL
jgi:hypothetical protein